MKKSVIILSVPILLGGLLLVAPLVYISGHSKGNIALQECKKQEKILYRKALNVCNKRFRHPFKRFRCRMDTYRFARKKIQGCDFVYGEPPGKRRRCEKRAKEEFRRRMKNCAFLRIEYQEPCRRNIWSVHRRRMKTCAKTR